MIEEGLSDCGSESKLYKQIDDLIKLHTEFKNLQIKFNEEKEKGVNLKEKNFCLKNDIKEMNKKIQKNNSDNKNKIQKINSEHENEIKNLNQNIQQLQAENVQKDEKINFLDKQIKKIGALTITLDNSVFSCVNFVKIKNKWSEIDRKCCENNCINTKNPVGDCIRGNGFVSINNDENIEYINCLEGKGCDKSVRIYADKAFKNPQSCFDYSLYYFELKCIFERKLNKGKNWMNIGLTDFSKDIKYLAKEAVIINEKDESFKLANFSWNNNDIFGCGLVYPPTNKKEEFPYVFFTQNGKQIGKATLVKKILDSFKPFAYLKCCSVEANFGNDLETRPFNYDISKHVLLKEFY